MGKCSYDDEAIAVAVCFYFWTHVHAEQALVKQTSVSVLVQFCSKILNNSFCNSFSAKVLHDPLIYKYTCCQQFLFYQGSTEATFTRHRKNFQRIENFDCTSSNRTRQYFRSVRAEPAYGLNFKPCEWFYNMPMRRVTVPRNQM